MTTRIALAQAASAVGNVSANLETAIDYIERAARSNAELVVFPELFLQGYLANAAFPETAIPIPGEVQEVLGALAVTHRMTIVMGLARADESYPHLVYNSAFLAFPDGGHSIYDKTHLGTYGEYVEGCYFAPGSRIGTHESPVGRLGVEICSDTTFPEVARVLALEGALLHVVLSAGPDEFKETWQALLTVRSLENAFFTVFVNTVGAQRGVNFFGRSRVIDPSGRTIAEAPENEEHLLLADIDLKEVARRRHRRLLFRDRIPNIYQVISEVQTSK